MGFFTVSSVLNPPLIERAFLELYILLLSYRKRECHHCHFNGFLTVSSVLIAVLFLAGCGGGSQSNTAEMPVDPFGPVDPFVPIEPVEPTLVVAVAQTPTFVKTLNLNTTYTGSGVVFANQDTGYWLDSPFWSTETRVRIITYDARTGQADKAIG